MLTRHSLVKTLIIFLFSGVFLLSCELQVNNQLLVKSKPTKIEYYVGDKLDLEGLVVTSINRKGKESLITDFSVEPENGTILNEAGTQYVTVSYKDCTVDFEIVVKDYAVEKLYITSIPKLAYYVGEKLDLSDLKVEALYNNGSVIEISDYVSEPKDGSVLAKTESGKQTVTIKFKEIECTFDIRICENKLENLTIDSIPEHTVYYCGDLLDISDLKVLAKFSDDTEVYVEDYNLSIPDKSDLLESGQQLVEISYLNKQLDFAINVLEPIVTIIEAPQNKSINLYDETKLKASVSVVGNGDVYFEWYRKINENEDFVCLEKSESLKNDKNQVYVTELKVNPNPYVQPEFESYVIVKNNKFEITKKIGSSIIKQNIETDLPVCIINSNNIPIVSTTRDIESKISIVDKENPLENIDAVVRVRGNATATYPKRPYKIKFNKKTSVLGMDKNKS